MKVVLAIRFLRLTSLGFFSYRKDSFENEHVCYMYIIFLFVSVSPKVVQFVLRRGQTLVLTGCHLSAVDISLEEGKCFVYIEVNYCLGLF